MIYILAFFIILAISVFCYWGFLHTEKARAVFLLILSIFFSSVLSISHTFYFLFLISAVYAGGILIRKGRLNKKIILAVILVPLIANLLLIKYVVALIRINPWFLPFSKSGFAGIFFPVGISYITFKLIHYIIEIYRDGLSEGPFTGFALYILFFPTFLAGPVERFGIFYPQLKRKKHLAVDTVNYGLMRISLGLVKKMLIADSLARVLMPVFFSPEAFPRFILLLSIYGLAFQIYMDFAGYTDMAIGIARLFGYRIMENFNKPYLSENLALFWRRWHISVYSWIRDYFFFPLFGSRTSRVKMYVGITATMFIFLAWHGLSANFLLLGFYHGAGLLLWRLFRDVKNRLAPVDSIFSKRCFIPLNIFITFTFVSCGDLFLIMDFKNALNIISKIIIF